MSIILIKVNEVFTYLTFLKENSFSTEAKINILYREAIHTDTSFTFI